MFYDRFKQLCDRKGVSCNKAALEMGLSNATVPKWKKTGATPGGETLNKIALYFGVSVDFLLNGDPAETAAPAETHSVSKEEILFALFRGREELITESLFEEVQDFADFIAQRELKKKERSF